MRNNYSICNVLNQNGTILYVLNFNFEMINVIKIETN